MPPLHTQQGAALVVVLQSPAIATRIAFPDCANGRAGRMKLWETLMLLWPWLGRVDDSHGLAFLRLLLPN